jgi:putative RecB family exonuclease
MTQRSVTQVHLILAVGKNLDSATDKEKEVPMSTAMAGPPCAPGDSQMRAPNKLAHRITGRTYISHSQLALMQSCPRKFAFTYIEKAPRDFIPNSLIFGGSIHAALELYYRCRLEGLGVTLPAILSAYHDAWRRQTAEDDAPVRFNKGEDRNTADAMADRMLRAFLASPLATPRGVILGIEEELRVVLDPALPDLLAKVDLVTVTDGALFVIDFKTSRSRWTEQKAQEAGGQLLLYGQTVARMGLYLDVPVKLHFAILTKHKTPQVQLLPVTGDAGIVTALTDSIGQVWQAIQSGNFYPNPSPQNCVTCPFRSRCSVFVSRENFTVDQKA